MILPGGVACVLGEDAGGDAAVGAGGGPEAVGAVAERS